MLASQVRSRQALLAQSQMLHQQRLTLSPATPHSSCSAGLADVTSHLTSCQCPRTCCSGFRRQSAPAWKMTAMARHCTRCAGAPLLRRARASRLPGPPPRIPHRTPMRCCATGCSTPRARLRGGLYMQTQPVSFLLQSRPADLQPGGGCVRERGLGTCDSGGSGLRLRQQLMRRSRLQRSAPRRSRTTRCGCGAGARGAVQAAATAGRRGAGPMPEPAARAGACLAWTLAAAAPAGAGQWWLRRLLALARLQVEMWRGTGQPSRDGRLSRRTWRQRKTEIGRAHV